MVGIVRPASAPAGALARGRSAPEARGRAGRGSNLDGSFISGNRPETAEANWLWDGVIKVTSGAVRMGIAKNHPRNPGKKGEIEGWTRASARNFAFEVSRIEWMSLPDRLAAVTLTLPTWVDWEARAGVGKRRALLNVWDALRKALARNGYRWAVMCWESTETGTPHMHLTADFNGRYVEFRGWIVEWWRTYWRGAPSSRGQHVSVVHNLEGWLKYCAKHTARSVMKKQRFLTGLWGKQGRMWRIASWVERSEVTRHVVTPDDFWLLRRRLRRKAKAEARADIGSVGLNRFCRLVPGADGKTRKIALRRHGALVAAQRLPQVRAKGVPFPDIARRRASHVRGVFASGLDVVACVTAWLRELGHEPEIAW